MIGCHFYCGKTILCHAEVLETLRLDPFWLSINVGDTKHQEKQYF